MHALRASPRLGELIDEMRLTGIWDPLEGRRDLWRFAFPLITSALAYAAALCAIQEVDIWSGLASGIVATLGIALSTSFFVSLKEFDAFHWVDLALSIPALAVACLCAGWSLTESAIPLLLGAMLYLSSATIARPYQSVGANRRALSLWKYLAAPMLASHAFLGLYRLDRRQRTVRVSRSLLWRLDRALDDDIDARVHEVAKVAMCQVLHLNPTTAHLPRLDHMQTTGPVKPIERKETEYLLVAAKPVRSGVLVLYGKPGLGKSIILEHLHESGALGDGPMVRVKVTGDDGSAVDDLIGRIHREICLEILSHCGLKASRGSSGFTLADRAWKAKRSAVALGFGVFLILSYIAVIYLTGTLLGGPDMSWINPIGMVYQLISQREAWGGSAMRSIKEDREQLFGLVVALLTLSVVLAFALNSYTRRTKEIVKLIRRTRKCLNAQWVISESRTGEFEWSPSSPPKWKGGRGTTRSPIANRGVIIGELSAFVRDITHISPRTFSAITLIIDGISLSSDGDSSAVLRQLEGLFRAVPLRFILGISYEGTAFDAQLEACGIDKSVRVKRELPALTLSESLELKSCLGVDLPPAFVAVAHVWSKGNALQLQRTASEMEITCRERMRTSPTGLDYVAIELALKGVIASLESGRQADSQWLSDVEEVRSVRDAAGARHLVSTMHAAMAEVSYSEPGNPPEGVWKKQFLDCLELARKTLESAEAQRSGAIDDICASGITVTGE